MRHGPAGRVTDVERATTEGFARGVFRVAGLEAPHLAQTLEVQFQNENLVARLDGALVACVPDLICCVETASEQCSARGCAGGTPCTAMSPGTEAAPLSRERPPVNTNTQAVRRWQQRSCGTACSSQWLPCRRTRCCARRAGWRWWGPRPLGWSA